MARVAVVIPTWNRAELLEKVLESLARQTHPVDRVIVVDNGSTDNSAEIARRSGADVLSLGRNAGFAAAVNRGIVELISSPAPPDFIAIVNNDLTVASGWLERLLTGMGAASFATGKILDAAAPERIEGSFDAICRGGCALRCGNGRADGPLWNLPRTIRLAPLTAAVFRIDVFRRVGFLDERFQTYLEDVDFGLRCSEAGITGVYVPEAVAYHQGSATWGRWNRKAVRSIARNQVLLIAKHYPPNWILRYGWSVLVAQALWGFVALRHGALLAFLAGKLDGMREFRQARGKHGAHFPAIIEESEKEIREIQQLTGFDLYWRLYFALTGWRAPA